MAQQVSIQKRKRMVLRPHAGIKCSASEHSKRMPVCHTLKLNGRQAAIQKESVWFFNHTPKLNV